MKRIIDNKDMEVYEMEFYKYAEHKQTVQKESAKRIAAIRQKYQSNIKNINYTKIGLQNLEHSLMNELSEQLMQLRAGFITQASEGTQANKRALIEQRMAQQPKTQGEQLCEYMKFFKQVKVYESMVQSQGPDMELLNTLATDDSISKDVFECIKSSMIQVAPQEEKANYRSIKKQDTAMNKIMADINDLEAIKQNVNVPIVGIEFADQSQSMYTLVTGKDLSDFYFNGEHTEEVI